MAAAVNATAARVTLEQLIAKQPTPANFAQQYRLAALEIKLGELKQLVTQINSAGGITNSTVATDLATLTSLL